MTTTINPLKVIVFGSTGPIGTGVIRILSMKYPDWTIYAVSRSKEGTLVANLQKLYPNVQCVQGDVLNKDQVISLSKECDIIYSCIGLPKYERKYWAKNWPIVVDNLLAAVTDDAIQKKKLVFCDNIYAYGPGTNKSPKSDTVEASMKSKPGIRATLRQKFETHMVQYPGTISVVGGADFFGPSVTSNSFLGDTFTGSIVKCALKGTKKPTALIIGSASVVHDVCYSDDFSMALVTVSVNDKAYDKFWICPHTIHGKTFQQVANDVADVAYKLVAGREEKNPQPVEEQKQIVSMTVLPYWMLYVFSPFMSFMSEMVEMVDFFRKDYTVDDSDFCTEFNVKATPYDVAIKKYVEFYIDLYQSKSNS